MIAALVLLAAGAISAAADPGATPAGAPKPGFELPQNASAAVRWNIFARELVLHGRVESFQVFAALSLAQVRAWKDVPAAQAIADVSAALLSEVFPSSRHEIAERRATELAAHPDPRSTDTEGATSPAKPSRTIARETLAFVRRTCPSSIRVARDPHALWTSAQGRVPVGESIPKLCPVAKDSRLPRSAAPPKAGSPEFAAALEAVRSAVRGATPDQRLAIDLWAAARGGEQAPAIWNAVADRLLVRHPKDELAAAQVLERLNLAMREAAIACFTEKYSYLTWRPSQTDPTLRPLASLPNFPSYPSAHACFSGAAAQVLASEFPEEKGFVDGLAQEATGSRVGAGLHYPFDGEAGLTLGRAAAVSALSIDLTDAR